MKGNLIKYIASALICVCLMMMAITERSVFLYAVIGISILFIQRPEVVFSAYFIASLSGGYFSVGSLGASRILSIVLIVSLLLQWREFSKISPILIFLEILILLYNLFSCLFSVTGEMSGFLIMLQCLLVTFLMQQSVKLDTELLTHLIIISSAFAIVMLGVHMMQDATLLFEERYSGAEDTNTNKFAMMCAQLGAVMIGAFVYLKYKPIKIASLAAYAISIVIIVMSGSRSALLGLLVASLCLVFFIQTAGISKSILPTALIALVGVGLFFFFSSIDSPILERFSLDNVIESGGTGRQDFSRQIFNEVILRHPLFGVGLGGQNVMALGIEKQAHNIVVDPISQLGVVGFVIYLCFIAPIVVRALKLRKKNPFITIPLTLFFTGLFNGIGEVIFYEKLFWNSIALCALIVSQSQVLIKHPSTVSISEQNGKV